MSEPRPTSGTAPTGGTGPAGDTGSTNGPGPVGGTTVESSATNPEPERINRGPGRVLVVVYLIFAIAATARAGVQIATKFGDAPVAYLLSALAAVVYIAATVGLSRGDRGGWRLALACCTVELLGVLVVGSLSVFDASLFPDDTVWSRFGQGYGYVPLVLPVLGLLWLRRTRSLR